ncbi:hypothetical protein MHUMG1_07287 [Metarhizium humberi]|uniref:Uncharacterized protein n=1 Tax=Metarhizium humberi TaxID=2596975 RepID=A0A9P8S594_9HYPO|nr:hypothetical protein MHUMG1_07287 [Metarhizium humberi]
MISQRRQIIAIHTALSPPQPQLGTIIRPQVTPQRRPPGTEQRPAKESHEPSLVVDLPRHRPQGHSPILPSALTAPTTRPRRREHHPRLHNITRRGDPCRNSPGAPRTRTRDQTRLQNPLLAASLTSPLPSPRAQMLENRKLQRCKWQVARYKRRVPREQPSRCVASGKLPPGLKGRRRA